jgi:hypothetical protein
MMTISLSQDLHCHVPALGFPRHAHDKARPKTLATIKNRRYRLKTVIPASKSLQSALLARKQLQCRFLN